MGKNLSSKRKFVDPSSFHLVAPPSPKALDVSASSQRQGRERASHVRGFYGAILNTREAGIAVKLWALEEKELCRELGEHSNDHIWHSRSSMSSPLPTCTDSSHALATFTLESQSPQSILVPPGILCLCAYSFPCPGCSCLTVPLYPHSHSHQLVNLLRVMLSIKATLVLPNYRP